MTALLLLAATPSPAPPSGTQHLDVKNWLICVAGSLIVLGLVILARPKDGGRR